MTEEKKKAVEIYEIIKDTFLDNAEYYNNGDGDCYLDNKKEVFKALAYRCVDELIKNAPSESLVISVETIETAYKQTIQNKEFWQNVKKEIELI